MKGKEIIDAIVREEMPDMELVLVNCVHQAKVGSRTNRKMKLVPVLAATMILAISTTALAFTFGWHKSLIQYFNPSEKQMAELSSAVDSPQAALVTEDGITVNMLETFVIGKDFYYLYEIILPEQISFTDNIKTRESLKITGPDGSENGELSSSLELLERAGNRQTLMQRQAHTNVIENNSLIEFDCRVYRLIYDGNGQMFGIESFINGDWVLTGELDESGYVSENTYAASNPEFLDNKPVLSWTLNYSEINLIKLEPDSAFPGTDGSVISDLVVSPVMMYIHITGEDVMYKIKPIINFKDGTQIVVDTMNKAWDAGADAEGRTQMTWHIDYGTDLRYVFTKLIDIEDIESVEINGVTIPVR